MDTNIIQSFAKRAKRKYINTPIVKHLAALDSPLHKAYVSTFQCSSAILVSDGKSQSRYCKRPWCVVCNSIKTAIRINNNQERLDQLKAVAGLYMTTLTLPNCDGNQIAESLNLFRQHFTQFRNTYKKTRGLKLQGTYAFEITYNPRTGKYHPHIHILHQSLPLEVLNLGETLIRKEYANCCKFYYVSNIRYINPIIQYWLKKVPTCSVLAQHTVECTNIIEAFKYCAKGISTVKTQDPVTGKMIKEPVIHVQELDTIYQAIKGMRMFQPFGFPKLENIIDENDDNEMDKLSAQATNSPDAVYLWKVHEWYAVEAKQDIIDLETGEWQGVTIAKLSSPLPLSGFVPKRNLRNKYEKFETNQYYQSNNNP